jgi:DNA-binding MarR family transcriptional regulator
MTTMNENSNYEVIWLVRRLFRAMADVADHYLRDDDLTAADRAVMEFLYPEEKLSVPAIAGRYRVSRQHIQVTANQLRSKGLLRTEPNPQHKRSQLLRLSELGRETFAEIRRNEASAVEKLFADLSENDVNVTRILLRSLLERCESGALS